MTLASGSPILTETASQIRAVAHELLVSDSRDMLTGQIDALLNCVARLVAVEEMMRESMVDLTEGTND